MIGKKINQLATELAPVSTDLTIIGDPTTGVSKKITLAQLGAIFSGAVSFYSNLAGFPAVGDINVIYCAKDTQKLYLWSGSAYVEVFPSQALLDTYQLRSEKGNANGYASLDNQGKVPISQLPSSIMEYKGTWNAATNTPTLANGTGDTGDVYICNVAGTVNFGAGPLTFAVGDYVIYSGTIWQRSSGAVGTVTSVAVSRSGDALAITGSPVTTSGTINIGFAGNSTQYINGAGNLVTFPGVINEAQNLITEVYNKTGATLTKGTVVYINGGQGNLPTITKALATGDSTSAQTYGIVRNDITNNNNGYVVVAGRISDLDTQAYTEGTQLYLSPTTAGTFTSTKPYAPQHLVYVGIVVRAHPTQGVVEVKIQNGYELDELHNVAAQSPSNGDILQYVSSTSLWTKVAGTTSNIAEGSNLYYTDARSRAALSFTAGSGAYNSTTGVITIPTNTNQLTNGANYITLASLSAGAGISYNNTTGVIASTITQYTDALARAAISLTTTGTSGAATYNNTTGVLNIPQYADQFVGTVTSVGLSAPTGFSVSGSPVTSSGTLALSFASGYSLPTTAKQTTWDTAYDRSLTAASVSGTTTKTLTLTKQDGSTLTASWTDINTDAVTSVFGRTGAVVATSGDYTTAQVTENTNLYFTNARAIASTLTGYTSGAGTITSSDSILSAIQKLNGNIGALTTGVSSVNGLTGAVTLTTSNIAEGTNLYYTEARVSANTDVAANTAARHNAVTIGTANGLSLSTQVLSLALASGSTTGALSSTDWTTFNNKQSALTNPVTGTGTTNYLPKFTGTSTIGNSLVYDNGTSVAIGGTTMNVTGLNVQTSGANLTGTTAYVNINAAVSGYGLSIGGDGTRQSGVISGYQGVDFYTYNGGWLRTLTLDYKGNLGLGVTPSAWGASFYKVIEGGDSNNSSAIGFRTDTNGIELFANSFFNGTNNIYKYNGSASLYQNTNGEHIWYNAPSGTAGNAISFTQAMTLDASGNLMVGDTSTYNVRMNVVGAGATTSTGSGSSNIVMLLRDTSAGGINVGAGLGFAGNDGVNTGVTFATINGRKENSTSGNYASYLSFRTRANGDVLTEQLRIASTGAATFSSSVTATTYTSLSSTPQMDFVLNINTAFKHSIVASNFSSSPVSLNALDFRVANGSNSQVTVMTMNGAGNVGIGTSSPNHLLSLSASASNGTVIGFYNTFNDARNRNWGIATNQVAFGDFHIMQSNAKDGNPISAGTSRLTIASTGAATFSSSVRAGNNFVAQGTLQGYSGAGIFMSYESYGGRLESYDYSTSSWKNIAIAPNGGNVGIGLTNPSYKLDVNGSFSFTTGGNYLQYASGILYHGNYYQYPSGDNYLLYARTGGALLFGSNDTERMRITSGGLVGIGTATPATRLHVRGASTGTLTSVVYFEDNSTNQNGLAVRAGTGRVDLLATWGGTGINTDLTLTPTNSSGAQNEAMRITSGGNVEIATGSIKTGEPDTGWGRAAIKIGARQSGEAFSSGGYLPVNVDGTVYYINLYSSTP
jgi:hypothetical protein